MHCKIFLSCGQRPEEKEVASAIARLLQERGFSPYVAIDVQTILDINGGIIRELKDSDCYLFVNFRRERIGTDYRGSLFSNQEMAIAYALGFDRFLVINQEGVRSEGMLAYIGINTETFAESADCAAAVERALDRAQWTPDYSRRLQAGELRWQPNISYGSLSGSFLYLDIRNGRPDIAAMETTARLTEFGREGDNLQPCPIRSPLKATGRPGFAQTIFPGSHEAFDILCVGSDSSRAPYGLSASGNNMTTLPSQVGVYLNSALDVTPKPALPIVDGNWRLRYEVYAIGFPLLSVLVRLRLGSGRQPQAEIVNLPDRKKLSNGEE